MAKRKTIKATTVADTWIMGFTKALRASALPTTGVLRLLKESLRQPKPPEAE